MFLASINEVKVSKMGVEHFGTTGCEFVSSEQRVAHTRDVVEKLHLHLEKLICTRTGCVGHHLLGQMLAATRYGNHSVGVCPHRCDVVPRHIVHHLVDREEQHTFGGGGHHLVYHHYQAVDMPLLVNDIFDERMHLAVGERIELHHEGMRAVGIVRVVLAKQSAVGSKIAAVPHEVEGRRVCAGSRLATVYRPHFYHPAPAFGSGAEEIAGIGSRPKFGRRDGRHIRRGVQTPEFGGPLAAARGKAVYQLGHRHVV